MNSFIRQLLKGRKIRLNAQLHTNAIFQQDIDDWKTNFMNKTTIAFVIC